MALIKCPECGATVSDKSQNCVHCGCPLSSVVATENTNEKRNENETKDNIQSIPVQETSERTPPTEPTLPGPKKKKTGIIVAAILLLSLIGVLLLVGLPKMQMAKLNGLMNEGNWEEALFYIQNTNNNQCKEYLEECAFNLGKTRMEEGEWELAAEAFQLAGSSKAISFYDECMQHTHSDKDYLIELEECLKFRDSAEAEKMQITDIMSREQKRLDQYKSGDFYSSDLKKLADDYYSKLDKLNKYYLDTEGLYDLDDYRDGYYGRMVAIHEMSERFGLLRDYPELLSVYEELYEELPKCFEVEDLFINEFDNNLEEVLQVDEDNQVKLVYKNTSDFTVAVSFTFCDMFTDAETEYTYYDFPRVKPNGTCEIPFPDMDHDESKGTWSWACYPDVYDIVD